MEWIYKSHWLRDFFTDELMIAKLKEDIMPLMIAYYVVLKQRQFLDFKHAKLTFNVVKPK